ERMFVTTPTSLFVLLLLLFAAPPPTSFSPLSLDDALPIYQFHALRHRRPDRHQCPGLPLSSLPPGLGLGRGLPCRPGLCPRVRAGALPAHRALCVPRGLSSTGGLHVHVDVPPRRTLSRRRQHA